MSDTILSGRWVIHYLADNRQKRLQRDLNVTPTVTDNLNAIYSAAQTFFAAQNQIDDGSLFSAQTPTEYKIGIIDPGDKDPWFIDRESVEYITKGALTTTSWLRAVGTNTGIVRMGYSPTVALDPTDIGRDILMTTDADRGTVLDYNSTAGVIWIRPDSNAAANSFDNSPTANGAWTIPNEDVGQVWQVDDSIASFINQTPGFNDATDANLTPFPATEAIADYVAIGFRQKFRKVVFDNVSASAVAGVGGVVAWEYWNGSAWTALTGVSDGTSGFTAAKADGQILTFTVPTDWTASILNNSALLYYIRARVTTVYTTNPVYDQGFIAGTGTGTQSGGTAVSGESLWAGIYNTGIATLEPNTHQYVVQNDALVVGYKSATDWWGDGEIDILLNVKEVGTEVDGGRSYVFARQGTKAYATFPLDLTTGGRNPAPLTTADDLDNTDGYRQFTGSTGTGTFVVGEVISKSGTNKKGVLTAVGGTGAAPILTYYLIGDPLTDFVNADTSVTGAISGATCTAGTPADVNAATFTDITITHGANETFDIDENGTTENYSIVINCANRTIDQVQQRLKYITRRGETSTAGTDGIQGQFYIGTDMKVTYVTLSGTIAEGTTVTGATSGATAVVVAHNTTDKFLMLRNTKGTFTNGEQVNQGGNNVTTTTMTVVTPELRSPFGTFPGKSKFFAAQGIVLQNLATADANKWQTIDDDGNVRQVPVKVTPTIGNSRVGDVISAFRLVAAGGDIKKDTYSGTAQSAGATTLVVGSSIATDEPGKSTGGVLFLVDNSSGAEYRLRFASWAGTTFTLASTTGLTADAGTTTTVIVDAAGAFNTNAKIGDLVRNTTRGLFSYIKTVDLDTQITLETAIAGQTTGDAYQINTLPVATETADKVYVSIFNVTEIVGTDGTPGSETTSLTYVADIPVRIRARKAGMIPYESDATITNTGLTNNIIRTTDTIFTP